MLQTQTVLPRTLEILKTLMQMPALSDCYLVGGTNLSLHFGHRMSDDLDLFSITPLQNEALIPALENQFPEFTYKTSSAVGIFGFIGDLKVDFVQYHQHPTVSSPHSTDGIRFMSIPDIVAMKINALMKRAVKKDFWDVAELLDHYSIDDFLQFYKAKFPSQQLLISIPQALVYFEDAEESVEPRSLKGQTWESVKKRIQKKVNEFLK